MKINYLIDETANFWYFVANLSEWNNYVRPNLNNYIVDITGPLSELEKQTLNSFKSIFKEYGYNQKFWGKDLLSGVEKNISEDPKFNSLTEISELKSRFEKLWSAEKTKLELWKNSLSSQYTVSQGIINDCDILFGKSNSDQDINVLLLISAPGNVAGGADIGDQWVPARGFRYEHPKHQARHRRPLARVNSPRLANREFPQFSKGCCQDIRSQRCRRLLSRRGYCRSCYWLATPLWVI